MALSLIIEAAHYCRGWELHVGSRHRCNASDRLGSCPELLASGHEVIGLALIDAAIATLRERGYTTHRGGLDDLDGRRAAASSAVGASHLAFKHADLSPIYAFGDALAGTDKPIVTASGTFRLAALIRIAVENAYFGRSVDRTRHRRPSHAALRCGKRRNTVAAG